jgi:hypothetical protein
MWLALLPWALFSIGVGAVLARPAVTGRLRRRGTASIAPAAAVSDPRSAEEGRRL